MQGKQALLLEQLRQLLATLPETLIGCRDRALLLVGYAGGFRRSELAALTCEDLRFTEEGLVVLLRRGKTDQTGAGRTVGIPYGSAPHTCPVRAVKRWLEQAGITTGPLFRGFSGRGQRLEQPLSGQQVWRILKRACADAGLKPEEFGAHSLRSGMVTQAIRGGASDHAIMAQTGHKSSEMVRRYRRETDLFRDNAGTKLGL